ncbi:hypothetical protein [Desulforhopalus sp. IMCC35007]|uniref:hypothetical protein n=1 Tax=Desulforhopalus sp. IMCC35007 TaxID=2569543 RepID=UPI0010AE6148|nr:hypothetical protein [Desulforhopalus sp. IMCC35007]TKB07037.1 hypothetical protein FCL48_18715 [Desulforhopalus sp. IMCC35007]
MNTLTDRDHLVITGSKDATCYGYCAACNKVHSLSAGNSRRYALELMAELEKNRRIDFINPDPEPIFSTDCLWKDRGGQMFGVLEGIDKNGNIVLLRAFSGQFNTCWQVEGWVPPTFDLEGYNQLLPNIDSSIQQLTGEIEHCQQIASQCQIRFEEAMGSGSLKAQKDCRRQMKEALKALALAKKKRRSYSRSRMTAFHDLYQLHNFRGEQRSIREVFNENRGIPTGSGDCCAPKLLQAAARMKLTPVGLSEFYFGKENKSFTRHHKKFYPCCTNKCQPILGYMLCGL